MLLAADIAPSRRIGRPSLYRPEVHATELTTNLCLLGLTDEQIAKFFGLEHKILEAWKGRFPAFAAAFTRGREGAGAAIAGALYRACTGYDHLGKHYPPNPVAISFFMRNRHGDLWQEKVAVQHDISDRVAERLEAARLRMLGELEAPVIDGEIQPSDSANRR